MQKLYEYRAAATRSNDVMWLNINERRISELEREIIEMRRQQSSTVFQVLSDKDEMTRNGVYKALLRISLLADACNEACCQAYDLLKQHGINGFSFQDKVKELKDKSRHIANVTLRSNNRTMEDFIVDNETFVDMCIKHADAHIKRKLKI